MVYLLKGHNVNWRPRPSKGPQSTHSLLSLMASAKTEMCQGVHLGPKSHQKSRFSPVSSSDSMTLRRVLSPMTRVQAYGSDACLHHLSNAMLGDDPKKEGLSSKVNFAAFSGTSKTMTHCSGGHTRPLLPTCLLLSCSSTRR